MHLFQKCPKYTFAGIQMHNYPKPSDDLYNENTKSFTPCAQGRDIIYGRPLCIILSDRKVHIKTNHRDFKRIQNISNCFSLPPLSHFVSLSFFFKFTMTCLCKQSRHLFLSFFSLSLSLYFVFDGRGANSIIMHRVNC